MNIVKSDGYKGQIVKCMNCGRVDTLLRFTSNGYCECSACGSQAIVKIEDAFKENTTEGAKE